MKNEKIRKITRVGAGRSLAIIIPANDLRSLGWRERQRVLVKRVPRGILIIDAKTKKRKRN